MAMTMTAAPRRSGHQSNKSLELRAGHASERGEHRSTNEDFLFSSPKLGVFVIADGMGGHPGGEAASAIAVAKLAATLCRVQRENELSLFDVEDAVHAAIDSILAEYGAMSQRRYELDRMGCTMAFLLIHHQQAFYGRVGDSRIYHATQHHCANLLSDESMSQALLDGGAVSPEEAKSSPFRHIVINSISRHGFDGHCDVRETAAVPGDQFILTTDGVSNEFDDHELCTFECRAWRPQTMATTLVAEALRRGSHDNASAIVVQVHPSQH